MRIIVCGAGQVGTTIARQLATEGISITVIDTDQDLIRRVDESHDIRGVVGHASHPDTLRNAGAKDADMLIAVTRSDEVNMVACQIAYSLFGVKRRIARLRHAGYTSRDANGLFAAEHLPIDVIISPEVEIAEGITRRLRTPGAFDIVPMANGQIELLGIHITDPGCTAVGERMADIACRDEFDGVSVVTIVRKGHPFIPDPSDRIEVGDDAYVLVRSDRRKAILALFGHRERVTGELVIAGSGNVGLHLAQKVMETLPKARINIIEYDRARAAYVAGLLGGEVAVLHGDVLDRGLLEEAQVGHKDAIVAVTNDDETNIFCSVLAKQAGCKRAITLVNKRSYEALIPSLGINAVVSPSAVTVSTVLRHVRRGIIFALHTLREDFGEVIEAKVTEGSGLLQQPFGRLDFPPGMKIGAVIRQGGVIIPNADTQIQVDDHVIAVVTYDNLQVAESIFGASRGRIL